MGLELFPARIVRSGKKNFECLLKKNDHLAVTGSIVEAECRPSLLRQSHIVVGDNVILAKSEHYVIQEVLPRKNEITRYLQRERQEKVIAANVDIVVIVVSCREPAFKKNLIDRYLTRSRLWNIPAVVVFNKSDLLISADDLDLTYEAKRIQELSLDCYEVSANDSQYSPTQLDSGFQELVAILRSKTAIFLGQSGVGKSSLISAISGQKVQLPQGELMKKISKGSHTTTWAELIALENFTVIDSPGIRSYSLQDLDENQLLEGFPDLHYGLTQCKFRNCKHLSTSKGCFFQNLDVSQLANMILLDRLDSYLKLENELEKIPYWEKDKND